jgi:exopolysaccharide production protein ExoZ
MRRLVHIQTLRFFAATAVVLFHSKGSAESYLGGTSRASALFDHGRYGVDLFFVISGFIIYYTTRRKDLSAGQFLRRRIERIVPIYWLSTFLLVALVILFPQALTHAASIDVGHLIKSLFYVSFVDAARPTVFLGWSLEFEMFFYLMVAALMWRLPVWITWDRVLPLLFLSLAAVGAFSAIRMALGPYRFFVQPFLIEFVLGVVIGQTLSGRVPKLELIALVLSIIALSIARGWLNRIVVVGLPCAAMVLVAARLSRSGGPIGHVEHVCEKIGDSSYSIYLIQVFTISTVCKVIAKLAPATDVDVLIAISTIVTVAAGYCSYLWVERPLLNLCRRRSPPVAVSANV